jgi:hypothetical protein
MAFDLNSMKRLFSTRAMKDAEELVMEMPERAGQSILIAGGIAWLIAAAGFVYVTMDAQKLAELRSEVFKTESLRPVVPTIVRQPVDKAQIDGFLAQNNDRYNNVLMEYKNNRLAVRTSSSSAFWAWREAIGHVFNGGEGWRINVHSLCVGRECKGDFLNGQFEVNTLTVQANN